MLLFLTFSFLAGAATIFAPCIWPLLPIVLASSAGGGRRKPLGITLGIVLSFALFTLTLAWLVRIVPFDPNRLRLVAVVVIALLGLCLVIPGLARQLEAAVSRLSSKLAPKASTGQQGFGSGFLTGASLGILWTPCAGPIFASVAAAAATQRVSGQVVGLTLAYVTGVGVPLLLLATFGNRLFSRARGLSAYTGRLQQAFGLIMIICAIGIYTNLDKTIQVKLVGLFPSYGRFVNRIEESAVVQHGLQTIQPSTARPPAAPKGLLNADYPAPEFAGLTNWMNTGQPLHMAQLRGKVVLVDFWTYTCINCIRTLPHLTRWDETYRDHGLVVVGIHTPEFEFEKDTANVRGALDQFGLKYPVAQDNDFATWNAFKNQFWPAEYLVDVRGRVRRTHFGEGEYDDMEMAIRRLLQESGQQVAGGLASMADETPVADISPETYFGTDRMEFYYPSGKVASGQGRFRPAPHLPVHHFSLGGGWTIQPEAALSGPGAVLEYRFVADRVFAVMRPVPGLRANAVKVLLDGKPIARDVSGDDVHQSRFVVDRDRLYSIVNLRGKTAEHLLRLEFQQPGTALFTFTFG